MKLLEWLYCSRWNGPMSFAWKFIIHAFILLFIIIFNFVNLNSQYYPDHHQHKSYVESSVPPTHISRYMPQHPSQTQYQSATFSRYASQGCQQSFQPLGFSSYIPQYSFQVPFTSNVFYGPSQIYHHRALVIVHRYLFKCVTWIMTTRKKMMITIIPTIMMMMMTTVLIMFLNNSTQLHVIILKQKEVEVTEQEDNKHRQFYGSATKETSLVILIIFWLNYNFILL